MSILIILNTILVKVITFFFDPSRIKTLQVFKKITKGSNLTAACDSSVKKTSRKVEKCLNVHRDKADEKQSRGLSRVYIVR